MTRASNLEDRIRTDWQDRERVLKSSRFSAIFSQSTIVYHSIAKTTVLNIIQSLIRLLQIPLFGGRMNLSPQHANYSVQSTGTTIKKKQRWDDEGVSATIGTIMSLLVFLTFLGMFTNQFLPVWMSDNESTHMSDAIGQFTTLKSSVDISISNYANSLIAPSSIFIPVTLSAPGVPVFAASTAGILTLTPHSINVRPMFNVSYTYTQAGGTSRVLNNSNDGASGGSLELYCPNRYYVEEKLIYENGAVILNQSDGEVVIAGPQFLAKNVGSGASSNIVVMLTQITLQGQNKTVGGTGSKGVNANLQFADSTEYDNNNSGGSALVFTITSQHSIAWENYFNNTLNGTAGMTYGHGYTIHKELKSFADKSRNYYIVRVSISSVKVFDHTHAVVNLDIGELVRT